jgi:hypothetical protein
MVAADFVEDKELNTSPLPTYFCLYITWTSHVLGICPEGGFNSAARTHCLLLL